MRTLLRSVSFLALASCALSAHALQFSLSYDAAGVTTNLTLSADAIAGSPGQFHITGLTGTRGAETVYGFVAGGPDQFSDGIYILNNRLYVPASPTYVDDLSFAFFAGTTEYNFCTQNGNPYSEISYTGATGYVFNDATNVNVAAVPGPMAALPFALMAIKRRKRKA